MLRRLMATSASLAVVGFGIATMPVSVHAATAGACVITGTAQIAPGLTPVPQSEGVTFGGSAACLGVLGTAVYTPTGAAGTNGPVAFNGSLSSCTGSIEAGACLGLSFVAGPLSGDSPGVLVQEGAVVEFGGVGSDGSGPVAIAGAAVFIPDPTSQGLDVQTVDFDGLVAGAGL